MHRLFAFEGVLGPGHISMTHNQRAGGIFIPSWAFSAIASIALFMSGVGVAYVKFQASTEQRLAVLERQIQTIQEERSRDYREVRELLLELKRRLK